MLGQNEFNYEQIIDNLDTIKIRIEKRYKFNLPLLTEAISLFVKAAQKHEDTRSSIKQAFFGLIMKILNE